MRQGIREPGCRIVAVDNAAAMIERCRAIVAEDARVAHLPTEVDDRRGDIRETEIHNASMVVLNYTLQFLPPDDRDAMLHRICQGLNDGGVLVLSEKVVDEDPSMEALLVDLHHEHKRRNDYSALEISRKRAALENVLVPETVSAHRARLKSAGLFALGRMAALLQFRVNRGAAMTALDLLGTDALANGSSQSASSTGMPHCSRY